MARRGRRSLGGWLKAAWLALGGPATVEDPSDLVNAELLFGALDRLESESGAWPEISDLEASVEGIRASPVGRDDAPVQIMTIHKAKGLEFDIVIVPDLQRAAPAGDRRLLYWTSIATGPGRRSVVLGSRSEAGEEAGAADPLEELDAHGWKRNVEPTNSGAWRTSPSRAPGASCTWSAAPGSVARRMSWNFACRAAEACCASSGRWFAPEFERALAARGSAEETTRGAGRPRLTAPPLMRIPLAWAAPVPQALPRAAALRILGDTESSVRPDFDWAGAIATAVGEVVHFELHRLARTGQPREALAARTGAWGRLLRETGVDEAHLPEALARTQEAIEGLLRSELAGRLLDPGTRTRPASLRSPRGLPAWCRACASIALLSTPRACAGSWTGRPAGTKAAIARRSWTANSSATAASSIAMRRQCGRWSRIGR